MLLALALLAPAIPAQANGLVGGISLPSQPPAAAPAHEADQPRSGEEHLPADVDPEERRRIYSTLPQKAPEGPTRFQLEDKKMFRAWIARLCNEEPVAEDHGLRLDMSRRTPALLKARNKQGSLRLLLENYVSDHQLAEGRTLTERSGMSYTHWRLSDRPEDRKAAAAARQSALKREFWELREVVALDGKPESLPKAREILKAIEESSTCGTRAVRKESFPHLVQK